MVDLIEFTRGVPPPESFPSERLAQCAQHVLHTEPQAILQYANARGYQPLRELLASQHGVDATQILLGQGSLQLLDHLVRLWVKPGDQVFVEQPTYDRVLTLIRRAGGVPVGIPIKEGGVDIEILTDLLNGGRKPVFFYVIPDFQNPSGSCMTLEKRQRIIALAKHFGFFMVEDSPYRQLRYQGEDIESLFSISSEVTIGMSSFSKLIAPGLRVGYMILPLNLQARLAAFAEETYINASYLNQAIVMEFIRRGWLSEQLKFLKTMYIQRLSALLSALSTCMNELAEWTKPHGGFFVSLDLDKKINPIVLADSERFGLKLSNGNGFFVQGGERFIRLPFCALPPEQLEEGARRLTRLVSR